jgi:hypothetical protein
VQSGVVAQLSTPVQSSAAAQPNTVAQSSVVVQSNRSQKHYHSGVLPLISQLYEESGLQPKVRWSSLQPKAKWSGGSQCTKSGYVL